MHHQTVAVFTHAKAYSEHPHFDIVGCVDPDREARKKFMASWGISIGFDAYDLVDIPYDIVSICTPTILHATALEQALRSNCRAVWSEKPLTDNLQLSEKIVRSYAKHDRPLIINYPRRWAAGVHELRREIKSGHYGNLQNTVVYYTKGLLNNGSHALDVLQYLLGDLTADKCLSVGIEEIPGDPNLDVQLRTDTGQHVYLFGYNGNSFTLFEIHMVFDKGRVSLIDSGFDIQIQHIQPSERFSGYYGLGKAKAHSSGLDTAMLNALKNIYCHITNNEYLLSTGQTALSVQRLCFELKSMSSEF